MADRENDGEDRRIIKNYKMRQAGGTETEAALAVEREINIYSDGEFMTRLACSDRELEELARGYLFGCRIGALKIVGDDIHVMTEGRDTAGELPLVIFSAEHILKCIGQMKRKSGLFKTTGAGHSCGLYDEKGCLYLCEDIGRHNAMDKVLGHMAMDGLKPEKVFMAADFMISEEMAMTAVNAGIPMLITAAAVTDKAVDTALENGLTLAGRAAGGKIDIYSGGGRIK